MVSPHLKLAPTAAFVMGLAEDYFLANPNTRRYFKSLDLSACRPLERDSEKAGVHGLTRELMCNRKFTIREAVLRGAADLGKSQLVILAAGLSPLGMDVLKEAPERLVRVYEVDSSDFDQKRRLIRRLVPGIMAKLRFVQADVRDRGLLSLFPDYDASLPSIVVLEGITHYLAKRDLADILRPFAAAGRRNLAVIEFGPPLAGLAEWVRPKAREAYRLIERRYFPRGMTKIPVAELKALVKSLGGEWLHHYRMDEMERLRLGRNRWFKEPNSGWVEVAAALI